MNPNPRIAIIVLNWNGWADTIECLESIRRSTYREYQIIVVDNGSDDQSVEQIRKWASGSLPVSSDFFDYDPGSKPIPVLIENSYHSTGERDVRNDGDESTKNSPDKIILIKIQENLGFAGGMNVGLRYVLKMNFDYVLLLNNDVVIKKDTLGNLLDVMRQHPEFPVATPNIYYYHQPDRIWNSGGRLTLTGDKRYYHLYKTGKKNFKRITFTTGCALLIQTRILNRYGLLTEDFFHGEEDYDFSLRMRKNKVKMMCVTDAVIYHKVGQTSAKLLDESLRLAFIHYLNRFVNQKKYYPRLYWRIWRLMALLYILPMLFFRYKQPVKSLIRLAHRLLQYSKCHEKVSKELVLKIKRAGL